MREFLEILLTQEGYVAATASGGIEAIARLKSSEPEPDVIVTDLKMAAGDGLQVLEYTKRNHPEIEVVMMTAFSTTDTAIRAMQLGAYDYVSKPFKVDEIRIIIEKCLQKRHLNQENRRLKLELEDRYGFDSIVGKSRPIRQVFEMVERVAATRTSVLIQGETGTGKELVAKAVHYNGPRQKHPFIVINCGAIPENLIESELFGHLKGSFTNASSDKKGLFREAAGGTLFLDEIGELSMALQVKLLRALQEKRIKPIGGAHELPVDVRIIAATNRDLEVEVREDRFRQDLYYRLNVIQIRIPALRERRDDIPLLAQHFIEKFCQEMGRPLLGMEPAAQDALLRYPYDGNVRELENIIERAVTFAVGDRIGLDSLPDRVAGHVSAGGEAGAVDIPPDGVNLDRVLETLERVYLTRALELTGGNRTEAAKLLGMSFRSIRYKLDKYDISD